MSLSTRSSSTATTHPRGPSETPNTRVSGKISTPPYSVAGKRSHAELETPVRSSDAPAKTLLLSPAFSSPQPPQQPVFEKSNTMAGAYIAPSAAIDSSSFLHAAKSTKSFSDAASEPFSDSFADSFNDELSADTSTASITQESGNPKRKKQKKARREPRDNNFSLASAEKPPYSYATLIGMAILSHPEKQLTLSSIYQWISETFRYYRRGDVGWQNSIRHNLSLNKAFIKGPKSKDGKGHLWLIESSSQDLFLKAKNNKKSSYHEVMDQLASVNKHPHPSIPSSPPVQTDDDSMNPANNRAKEGTQDAFQNGLSDSRVDRTNVRRDSAQSSFSLLRTPARVEHAPRSPEPLLAGRGLGFTSSFSCSSNFELSPLPALKTGPLLQPISPGVSSVLTHNFGQVSAPLPSISVTKSGAHLAQLQPPLTSTSTPRAAGTARTTPKSNVKTPLRLLRTPMSGTMIYKLGYSPSYLEEFYHSPFVSGRTVLNSYDDDDMLMKAFDSPAAGGTPRPSLLVELRKATSEDVCTTDTSSAGK